MNKPTFKAFEPQVNLALSLVGIVITVCLTFSNSAISKSMPYAEYRFLKNNIALEFNTAKSRCNTVRNVAFDKCLANAESIRNASKLELDAQRKIVVGAKQESKSNANTAKLESHKNSKSSNINTMPVLDELAPPFKKTRLI